MPITTDVKKIVISKSDYVLWRECPHNVWIKKWNPKVYYSTPLSEFEKHLIQSGNMVEETARKKFVGKLIEGRDSDSINRTKDWIDSGVDTIFQACFSDGKLFAAIDILKNTKDGLQLFEVKASNASKLGGEYESEESEVDAVVDENDPKALEKYRKSLFKDPHFYDLAFQVYLVQKIGYKISTAFLTRLNRQYVRKGEINLTNLFVIEDVTKYIIEALPSIEEDIEKMIPFLSSEIEPAGPCKCIYHGRSRHCTCFEHINPTIPKYGVHDLARIGNSRKKLCELIDSKIYEILDIPGDFLLTPRIQKQVDVHKAGNPDINHEEIKKELGALTFPLYFVDYESFNPAIPRYNGFKPYQHIPFQFSLHRLDSVDSKPVHYEFLSTDGRDPSEAFVKSLRKAVSSSGSVIVWSRAFEESHINKPL